LPNFPVAISSVAIFSVAVFAVNQLTPTCSSLDAKILELIKIMRGVEIVINGSGNIIFYTITKHF